MGMLRYLFKSDNDLSNEYEKERQRWIKTGFNGDGSHTKKMNSLKEKIQKITQDFIKA